MGGCDLSLDVAESLYMTHRFVLAAVDSLPCYFASDAGLRSGH